MVFYVDIGAKMNLTELVSVGMMLFTPVITDIPEDKSASVEWGKFSLEQIFEINTFYILSGSFNISRFQQMLVVAQWYEKKPLVSEMKAFLEIYSSDALNKTLRFL